MDLEKMVEGSNINGLLFATCPFCGGQMICNKREFVCYECGKHGDAADFLALKNKVNKTTARWQLNRESNADLYEALTIAEKYFSERLKDNSYLEKRGITKDEVKKFHLGWADGKLQNYLKDNGVDIVTAHRAGLVKLVGDTYRDVFYHRLMFPIFNHQGKVIGFGGRITNANSNAPKYLNSPETKVFQKKECLFGIQNLSSKKPVYLVEGYMDALTLQSYGINAVAALGTAIGAGHAHLLRSLKVENIILALDGDSAGVKNALKGLSALQEFNVQVLCNYKECKDPDEFIKKNGAEEFKKLPLMSVNKFKLKSGINPVDIL